MIRENFRAAVSVISAIVFLIPFAVMAQKKPAGPYPDLKIMDGVLEQLLDGVKSDEFDGARVTGSFIPGYGLLFVAERTGNVFGGEFLADRIRQGTFIDMHAFDSAMAAYDSSMAIYDSAMSAYDSALARLDLSQMKNQGPPISRRDSLRAHHRPIIKIQPPKIALPDKIEVRDEQLSKQTIATLDEQVMKFLESYADAENRLSSPQHVSVVILTGNDSGARYYSVARKEITDFRSQTLTDDAFRQKVRIRTLTKEDDSVNIMATILEKLVGEDKNRHMEMFGPNCKGVYLEGLGAYFICSLTSIPDFEVIEKKSTSIDNSSKIEKSVIRALGDYGSSLRFLPPDESILVSVRRESFGSGSRDILVVLSKKDIDAYSRNGIDLETLSKRAMVIQDR